MTETATEPQTAAPKRSGLLKILLLLAIIAAGVVLFRFTPLKQYASPTLLKSKLDLIRGFWWAGPAYALLYAVGCLVGFPGTVVTLIGGVAFGPWWGILWVVLGSNLGVNAAFWLARLLGKGWLDEKLKGGRLDMLNEKLARRGLASVIQLRLIPAVPFNILNFACGLTKVRWIEYAVGSFIGMLPATVAFVYFSGALFEAAVTKNPSPDARRASYISLGVGAALFVASFFIPMILKRFQKPAATP